MLNGILVNFLLCLVVSTGDPTVIMPLQHFETQAECVAVINNTMNPTYHDRLICVEVPYQKVSNNE